jgi:hypothetical protein
MGQGVAKLKQRGHWGALPIVGEALGTKVQGKIDRRRTDGGRSKKFLVFSRTSLPIRD